MQFGFYFIQFNDFSFLSYRETNFNVDGGKINMHSTKKNENGNCHVLFI